MIRLRHKMLIRATRLLDQAVLIATALGVIYFRPGLHFFGERKLVAMPGTIVDSLAILVLVLGWLAIFDYCVRYKGDRLVSLRAQLKSLVKATTLAAFWFLLASALFTLKSVEIEGVAIFWVVVTVFGVLSRVGLKLFLTRARRSGFNYRYLLIVGANPRSAELAAKIENRPELGYKLVGYVAESEESKQVWDAKEGKGQVLGLVEDLRSLLETERVDEMLVCLSVEAKFRTVAAIIADARDLGIVLRIVPDASEGAVLKKLHIEEFENEFVITFFREQLLLQLLVKRLIDVSVSVLVLAMLSPLMALVAILIKMTSSGPVIFAQDRVGMNQRRFRLYKFRSMVADADERKKELAHCNELDGPAFKMANDPRITRIGRLIRKTSIDELPQLFNVIKGEMSLVGPRPPLPDEVSKYQWLFRRRLSVKPGITCVWQVSGRSRTTFDEWMTMDKQYVENWSLMLDLKILLMTIPAVLFCRGAS
jgi:exopolysaccharide biosynthesis polyprenyl glycosylphosphotransferase